ILASLFDPPAVAAPGPAGPVARRDDQPQWQDPASGYLRRNISPPGVPQPMQIVEVHFPPGGRVAFETGGRDIRVHQQVWVLEGVMDITLGVERHRLREGDCLAMQLDRPTMFHNPTRKPARYAAVIASGAEGGRLWASCTRRRASAPRRSGVAWRKDLHSAACGPQARAKLLSNCPRDVPDRHDA
ncbi:MAG TPA: cupin domain-containing protein, partial [Dongiaceae bacterium]|nr:cupin domain-containing protein [Dongiaceae bacterium]